MQPAAWHGNRPFSANGTVLVGGQSHDPRALPNRHNQSSCTNTCILSLFPSAAGRSLRVTGPPPSVEGAHAISMVHVPVTQ